MHKITVMVQDMHCGMCESHINDALRRAFPVKKVRSSHRQGQTVLLSEQEIPSAQIREVLRQVGYTVGEITCEPWERKGQLDRLCRR